MKKNPAKYTYIVAFIIALIVFAISLIADYVVIISDANIQGKLSIYALAALFLGISISLGMTVFVPTLGDAMATLRRMLRLENLSNPLLMKLSTEAPGTYHHSINVSILAQKAAKSIGADSLLVRIAAYYHDLGKLEAPLLYVENQAGKEIPTSEDADSIRNNARLIIGHVEKGVIIAKENNLPEEIIDLIKEHHGTTKALYFYNKAREQGLKVKKTDFKYNGPIPSSKESLILMLSDCIEATARSLQNLTLDKINSIVNNTIEERSMENQFKNVDLSENDLAKIKSSLQNTLNSIYHQRIEYSK